MVDLYRAAVPKAGIEVWLGQEARERRLKSLSEPPRVLHLATHGFYLSSGAAVERPMLLSGLPLAGANPGLRGDLDPDGEDGVLYALEAASLALDGSELVALSACDTAQGTVDYSEGVYGLARAFRIAGAENVLMTLWPLADQRAKEFMVDFYNLWLNHDGFEDPAVALRAVKRSWSGRADSYYADPVAWAPYVLIQNGR